MKPRAIQKEDCHRYPLEYIIANLREHGVALDFKTPQQEYKVEEKLFWLALRETASNDNCVAFCVHNWPSIVQADPQWTPHTTQLWDTIVDVCNGGFPHNPYLHVDYICQYIPLLNDTHYCAFKKDIFNTWSDLQWSKIFNRIENFSSIKNSVEIISALTNLTDQDLSKYTAHVLLSWSAEHPQLFNDLAQTPIGQNALKYIENNSAIYVPYVLDAFDAFGEHPKAHKALFTLSQYMDIHLDESTQILIARSFMYWAGYNIAGQNLRDRYIQDNFKEYVWIKSIWSALPKHAHIQMIQDLDNYWHVIVRGVDNLLAWGFDAHVLCHYLEEEVADLGTTGKFPHIGAYLQSQRIQQNLPEVTYEKLRKL